MNPTSAAMVDLGFFIGSSTLHFAKFSEKSTWNRENWGALRTELPLRSANVCNTKFKYMPWMRNLNESSALL